MGDSVLKNQIMMKKELLLMLLMAVVAIIPLRADIVINGTAYHADTLLRRQVAPGTIHTIVRLPDYPLNIYLIEADMNNPNNRVETTFARNVLGNTELLSTAMARQTTPTKRPLVACNANFWIVSTTGPLAASQKLFPMGGVVRNDTTVVNDNNTYDQWGGGPWMTGAAGITIDKRQVMGRVMWEGSITSSKLAAPLPYHNFNRRAVRGEICMYNRLFKTGRAFEDDWINYDTRGDNQSDNYYLTFVTDENGVKEKWKTNSPMKFVINNIIYGEDRRSITYSNAALAVTGDENKAAMSVLQVGDTIEVTSGFRTLDEGQPELYPRIENLVWGQATLMLDGELTPRNYNDGYNTPNYSRTIYGTNGDGKRLYMMVIDLSTSPKYGLSRGCPTAEACQIMKSVWPDIQVAINMDAGGSAEMLVGGQVVNTTTEGNPRGVATGWMIEAIGEEDHEIASIAFDKFRIDIGEYSMTVPRVLGYNKIGELIDEDVKGFTLSCDAALGIANDTTFIAGGGDLRGELTATLNGMTATVPVHVMPAQPNLVLSPLLIDDREYPIELTSQIVNNTYYYDPSIFDWSVANSDIAVINDGVVRGKQNGTTFYTYNVGAYSGASELTVEISPDAYQDQTWEGWTVKGAGPKNINFNKETGEITCEYTSNRSPYLQLTKDLNLFGLPDTIALVFNTTMLVENVQIDTRNRFKTTTNYLKFKPENDATTFTAGEDHTLLIDLESLGGADYVGTYPITLKTIKFNISKDTEVGDHQLNLKSFYCHYPSHNITPLPPFGDVNLDGEVSVADVNAVIEVILTDVVNGAADVNHDGEVTVADINSVISVIVGQ